MGRRMSALREDPITLYIDADACPVKEEAYKVAFRHYIRVRVVANAPLMVPRHPLVERVIVPAGRMPPTISSSPVWRGVT